MQLHTYIRFYSISGWAYLCLNALFQRVRHSQIFRPPLIERLVADVEPTIAILVTAYAAAISQLSTTQVLEQWHRIPIVRFFSIPSTLVSTMISTSSCMMCTCKRHTLSSFRQHLCGGVRLPISYFVSSTVSGQYTGPCKATPPLWFPSRSKNDFVLRLTLLRCRTESSPGRSCFGVTVSRKMYRQTKHLNSHFPPSETPLDFQDLFTTLPPEQ
jgi:hypothetical protein